MVEQPAAANNAPTATAALWRGILFQARDSEGSRLHFAGDTFHEGDSFVPARFVVFKPLRIIKEHIPTIVGDDVAETSGPVEKRHRPGTTHQRPRAGHWGV
jgi:hypothetical protein